MREDNEDQCLLPQSKPDDQVAARDSHKKSKFSYTRDFLISLAELDTCKTLPAGFDISILREFDDQSSSLLPGYHHSDGGRFQSISSHCSWRNPQQGLLGQGLLGQGLLGSGTLARVHKAVAESSVPVLQDSGCHLLNRSSEPYRPPHLSKAKYDSGRESKDFYNGQTFGSSDDLSRERAEEERQRRDSFELMRKEKQLATQAKQKIVFDENMAKLNPGIAVVLDEFRVDKKVANKHYKYKGSEPCDVKEACSENSVLFSSVSTHQFPEAGNNDQLNKSGRVCINNSKKNVYEPISGIGIRDSESSALPGTQKQLTNRSKRDDTVESHIPLSVGDNCNIPSTFGTIGNIESIVFSNCVKQTGVTKRDSNLSVSDIQANEGLDHQGWPESKHNSLIRFDELDICLPDEDFLITVDDSNLSVSDIQANEGLDHQGRPESKHNSLIRFDELDICLPDEDSLITVDDYIYPQDSMFVAAGNTLNDERLADCGVATSDERFNLADFGSHTSFHGTHDPVSLDTSFKSPQKPQSYTQLHHSQLKTAKARMSPSKLQDRKRSSRIRPRKIKSYPYNLQSIQYYPNGYLTSPQYLQATATGVDHSVNHQCLQVLPIPGLPHQSYGLPRVAYPQYTSNEMVYYTGEQNAMLNSSPSFKQQCYSNLGNASSRYYEMGIGSRADASPKYGWSYPGSFAKTG
ncbi:hypothetical protein CCACVL1_09349 [Corchorus capsularis]|uniref:Uncharacterized protein n=1 Tax=Corchorus capsularis TaxID=210143 RepID=A0A1R3IWM9_COCAP|nr:hypothetical protein CCACVL1_09349 [Corchorus capsularis]